jgi:hypothetical protein
MANSEFPRARLTVAIIGVVISAVSAYLVVAGGNNWWPFHPSGRHLSDGFRHTWYGQIPVPLPGSSSVHLILKLGSGGVNEVVGSISSPELGCAAVVYLQKADAPVTLRLDTSDSPSGCELAKLFDTATISLLGDDALRFTVDVLGDPESCDFSLLGGPGGPLSLAH